MSEWIGTANHGFATLAMEELRRLFRDIKFVQLRAGEIFRMEVPFGREETLSDLLANEPIFLGIFRRSIVHCRFKGMLTICRHYQSWFVLRESSARGRR